MSNRMKIKPRRKRPSAHEQYKADCLHADRVVARIYVHTLVVTYIMDHLAGQLDQMAEADHMERGPYHVTYARLGEIRCCVGEQMNYVRDYYAQMLRPSYFSVLGHYAADYERDSDSAGMLMHDFAHEAGTPYYDFDREIMRLMGETDSRWPHLCGKLQVLHSLDNFLSTLTDCTMRRLREQLGQKMSCTPYRYRAPLTHHFAVVLDRLGNLAAICRRVMNAVDEVVRVFGDKYSPDSRIITEGEKAIARAVDDVSAAIGKSDTHENIACRLTGMYVRYYIGRCITAWRDDGCMPPDVRLELKAAIGDRYSLLMAFIGRMARSIYRSGDLDAIDVAEDMRRHAYKTVTDIEQIIINQY